MPMLLRYEDAMAASRADFSKRPGFAAAIAGQLEPRRLHHLLIQFCALGFQMTDKVEGWIRRAGERCQQLGYPELGKALISHAHHEAGHEQLFDQDTRALVELWNQRWSPTLSAEALLQQPATGGVRRYAELHEEVIVSDTPYRQVAIEYEIEAVSVREGAKLVGAVLQQLGPDVLGRLSFVKEHLAVDEGHTKFNARQLGRLLDDHPDALPHLIDAGRRALDAYATFLDDCHRLV